jgi:hypothetical protein
MMGAITEPEVYPPLSPDWRIIIINWFLRQERDDVRRRRPSLVAPDELAEAA